MLLIEKAASPVISVLLICMYIIFLYYLNLTCRIIALKTFTLHRSRHYRSGDESMVSYVHLAIKQTGIGFALAVFGSLVVLVVLLYTTAGPTATWFPIL